MELEITDGDTSILQLTYEVSSSKMSHIYPHCSLDNSLPSLATSASITSST